MSGIDEGMMPDHVRPQHPDDDTVDESVIRPHTGDEHDADDDDAGAEGAEDHSSTTGA